MLWANVVALGLGITAIVGGQTVSETTVLTSPDVQGYRDALRHGSMGDLRRAREELDAVLRLDPTHMSAKLRRKTLDDVESGVIVPMTAVHLFRATEHSSESRHRAALAELDSGIALNPRYDEAFRLRGRTRIALGEVQPAIEDYNSAIALNPRRPTAIANRGMAFLRIGELDRALRDFNTAIELEPLNADTYIDRGTVYIKQSRLTEAMADFDRAIQHNPGSGPAYANKALLYENLWRLDEAVETYKALVRNARGYPDLVEHAKDRIRFLQRH